MADGVPQELVETVLAVPLHRTLGLWGINPGDAAAGVELDAHDPGLNRSGVLHGAVAPLLMDVACYLAVMAEPEPGAGAVTVSIASSLLAAVPAGATVRARGRIDRRGAASRICLRRCRPARRLGSQQTRATRVDRGRWSSADRHVPSAAGKAPSCG